MRKAILLFGLILAASFSAAAQDSKYEIFAGYTFAHENSTDNVSSNANGGSLDGGFFPLAHLGLIANVGGGESRSFTAPLAGVTTTYHASSASFHYLAGPRVRYNVSHVAVYFQVLGGGVTRSAVVDNTVADAYLVPGFGTVGAATIPYTFAPATTSWAVEPAVGVDFSLGKHWAIRLAQLGETLTNFPSVRTGSSELQYTFTISSGVVWKP
jgi:hypothetical protein